MPFPLNSQGIFVSSQFSAFHYPNHATCPPPEVPQTRSENFVLAAHEADPARLGSSVGFKRSIGTASLLQKKLQGTRHYLDGSTKTDAVRKYLICLLLRRKERSPKGNKILITLFLLNSERGRFAHIPHILMIKQQKRMQRHVVDPLKLQDTTEGPCSARPQHSSQPHEPLGGAVFPAESPGQRKSGLYNALLANFILGFITKFMYRSSKESTDSSFMFSALRVISTRRIFNKKCTESKTYEVKCSKSFHMESLRYETKKCFTKKAVTFRGQSEVCRLTLEVQGGSNISPKKPKASALRTDLNRQGARAALLASFRGGVSFSSYTTQQERRLWGGSSDLRTPPVV
ncbi:hypothetical protein MJT46_009381 [Ovis ammon polii x Ovis aries]|nr:hypothetical protein MJT46_009381 [Ovis ammon polii x Ovis aries]